MATMKRNIKLVVVLLCATLIVGMVIEVKWRFFSNLARPLWLPGGVEGAKVSLVGVRGLVQGWDNWGVPVEAKLGNAIEWHNFLGSWDKNSFYNSDPNNMIINNVHHYLDGAEDHLQFLVETQKEIQLENLDYMGDPLNWNETHQLDIVQYQPLQDRSVINWQLPNGDYRYQLVKRSILIVPGEAHITLSIKPGNEPTEHSSGWQEGGVFPIELWFKVDFTVWSTWGYEGVDSMPPSIPANATDWVANPYNRKGGFPVTAWIQGYKKNILEDWDASVWKQIRSDGAQPDKWITEHSKANLDALTQTTPELIGSSVTFFSDWINPYEQYTGSGTGFVEILDDARRVYPWAGGAVAPSYFAIAVGPTFSTLTEGGAFGPWDIYYPAVNYRIRILFAIYGEFTYLWTTKTANDTGYPGWEDRTVTIVHSAGYFDWLTSILSNPMFQLFLFMFMVLIIIVLLAIFAPGVLMVISAVGKRGAEKIQESGKKKKNHAFVQIPWDVILGERY